MNLLGIHHLTAVTANVRENYRFYTEVLGLRLVKRSVNQDDVTAYHLFYADAVGSPGTDITFFDWPAAPEKRGTHSIVRTCMRVTGAASLEWWAARLRDQGVTAGEVFERDGRATIDFEDPEGQRLSLVDDGGAGDAPRHWERSTVPAEHQIRGLGPIVMSVPSITETHAVLTQVLNMRATREYGLMGGGQDNVHVYEMRQGEAQAQAQAQEGQGQGQGQGEGEGEAGAHAELHVAVQPDLPAARLGRGGVHHVAFRTPTEVEYHGWTERLNEMGVPNSGEIDRYWFRSLYFREPNGILFEIATDGPGFGVDEDLETLGEKVVLPPFLERHRESIVARLKPIE